MTIFEKIIAKEIPAHIIFENEDFIAILDISPLEVGHTLLVPKKPTRWFHEMAQEEFSNFTNTGYDLSKVLIEKLSLESVKLLIHGVEVEHTHLHLIPMYPEGVKVKSYSLSELAQLLK